MERLIAASFDAIGTYMMIGGYSRTPLEALVRSAWQALALLVLWFVATRLTPARLQLFMRTGGLRGWLLVRVPLFGGLVDLHARLVRDQPPFIQLVRAAVVDCVVAVFLAVAAPASVLTWASVSTFVALVTSSLWALRALMIKGRLLKDRPLSLVTFVPFCVLITSVATGLIALAMLLARLRPFLRFLTPALSPATCVACVAGSGVLAMLYLVATGLPKGPVPGLPWTSKYSVSDTREESETVHVQLSTLAALTSTIVCIMVRRISARS